MILGEGSHSVKDLTRVAGLCLMFSSPASL